MKYSQRDITSVGMQGRLQQAIEGTGLEVVPQAEESPVSLWIEAAEREGNVTTYDLRYTILTPGSHNLAHYLRRQDGSQTPIPPLHVECLSLLSDEHDGSLIFEPRPLVGQHAEISFVPAVSMALWVTVTTALFLVLTFRQRGRRAVQQPLPEALDEIRPLARLALAGTLSEEGRARLDRMITGYWRSRLGSRGLPAAAALQRLMEHEVIGSSMRDFQAWAHGRHPRSMRIEGLLRPFTLESPPEEAAWSSSAR